LVGYCSGWKGKRKGFTLVELIVIFIIVAILAGIAFFSYKKWRLRLDVENSARKLYAEVERYRMQAFTQKVPVNITVLDRKVIVSVNGTTKSFELSAPYRGSVSIDVKGLLSPGSIVYTGPMVGAKVSCLKMNKVRVRLGQTVEENGKRVCQ